VAAFAGYLAGQALVWLAAIMVVAVRLGAPADEEAIIGAIKPILPAVLPASVVAGGLGTLWTLRGWRPRLHPGDLVETLALRLGPHHQLLQGILAGATLGVVSLVLMPYVPYSPSSPDLMDELLGSPGPARWSWILSAVILAPPVEELVFRGVLLGGLAQIWSLRAAALVSGVTFWAMHAPEWLRYWPAAVAIGLMTLVVTVLRIRTRALGPPIAAHSAYNLLMASVVLGIPSDGAVPGPDEPKWAQLAPSSASHPREAEGRLKGVMDLGIRGKRALVTGSTAGIGLSTARTLAAEGAQVTVNGRTAPRVAQAVELLRRELPRASVQGIPADLSGAAGCNLLVRQLPAVATARPSSILKRFASPDEAAAMIAYVCSAPASATTGAAIRVDGGVVRSIV
jgi:membrane protease YdiL (CAAX protease family)